MPNVEIEQLDKNRVKLSFVVPVEETKPYLDEAATRISKQTAIPGFRAGKADYEIVKGRVGEMKILEEALESIVRKSFVSAVLEHDIDTVGTPDVDVGKLAPGNDIEFTAIVTRMPKTKELADVSKLSVKAQTPEIKETDIDLALRDVQRMQTKEVRATAEETATLEDKIVVSMNMKLDGVPVEGGQSPNHAIYLNEDYYIPGFKDEMVGTKEGEEKTFTLPFPENHVQTMLAGKDVLFEITLKELFHLQPPELDDEFAAALGMKDIGALRDTIKQNLLSEKEQEARASEEREMLEMVAKKSQFDDIPDMLVNDEIQKMIDELKRGVEAQGLEFATYLQNLNKTIPQMKIDFTTQALMRIKVALIMREIAKQEDISADEADIEAELDRVAEQYKEQKEAKDQIYSPQYREYMEQILRNRKVIEHLRGLIIKQ
jgi:trigger factor